jgi:predicted ribosomally synthesized peptide with nif11-like leader
MSKQTAIEFVKASENDLVLLEKIKAADSPADVVKIAAEYGYELTEREIKAIQTGSHIDWEDGELSEEQLEAVAGGLMMAAEPITCCCGGSSCVCQ